MRREDSDVGRACMQNPVQVSSDEAGVRFDISEVLLTKPYSKLYGTYSSWSCAHLLEYQYKYGMEGLSQHLSHDMETG